MALANLIPEADMVLAFRLYGDFQWPPSPARPLGDRRQAGILEIWLLADGDGSRAALRWQPGQASPLPDLLEPDDVMPITTASASAYLVAETDKYLAGKVPAPAIWLDEAAQHAGLTFRDAFLIEEFRETGALVLQLPLATGVTYKTSASMPAEGGADAMPASPTYSGLRIFTDDDGAAAYALQIHLPLPVRQSKNSDARAFPLVLQYRATSSDALAMPPRINRLFGGWVEDNGSGGRKVELKHRIPDGRFWFGGFGFSERGRVDKNYARRFAIYPGTFKELADYWPSNAACFVDDVVNAYGFSISPTHWLGPSDNDPADLSLRFWSAENAPVTGLVYRVRVDRDFAGGMGNAGSDLIAVKENNQGFLKLRLAHELSGEIGNELYYGKGEVVGGWLKTGAKLAADCRIAWTIEDRGWSSPVTRAADWRPTVALHLHWAETISSIVPDEDAPMEPFEAGLLGAATLTFEQVRNALLQGEAGQPVSFLPDLALDGGTSRARFSLYGTPIAAAQDERGIVSWGQLIEDGRPTRDWARPPMRLSLASSADLIEYTPEYDNDLELTLIASSMSFFRPRDAAVTLTLSHDASWPPTAAGSVRAGFFASYALESRVEKAWAGRLASLEFTAGAKLDEPSEGPLKGHLRIGGDGSALAQGQGGPALLYPQGRVAAEISLPLAASSVMPVTVDVQRFDRSGRAAPLLIDLGEVPGAVAVQQQNQVRYWLRATETILPREDRSLTAEILDKAKDASRRAYAVLSAQPFSVFRFTDEPLASRGSQEGTSVAIYNGDARGWQYKLVSRRYRYSLPPQAIGESADKPGRLEIHDLPEGDLSAPPRPFVRHDKNGQIDEAASSLERRAVEFQLTPSAELWITPSDLSRGYFMPEATSHDIFRQFGAYGLGAALAYLRAEFLYGMPVGIDVSKESATALGARVAEIEAIVGRPTGPAREVDADPILADRWESVRQVVARRPERLEIWARDLDSDVDFTPARFSDGVAFALRDTALHRAPVIDGSATVLPEGTEAHKNWPVVGEQVWPPASELGEAPPARPLAVPRHHPQGASGGALWPVESLNLLNVLLAQPQSSGGTIERIALSPLGGDAAQKAEFLNGQMAIISETYNGRVQRLQVEVIGRIGALWHRAKHVVVYERTVNPSAQFAPKEDTEKTRSRRPILRKVREYIELLQPERGYPDFSAATARNAGFLDRVRFNSRIINVDSAWSSEVGDYGWQIPLWNKLSARERPQVYPMPDIAFVTVADGEGERPVVAQDCVDPDQLYFFADFKAGTSDTDSWATRLGIDYANMPAAQSIAKVADAAQDAALFAVSPGAPERRRRAVTRILPGLRRFTWRLAPAAQKTAINAGRAGKPVYVGLESVSFMRATHQEDAHKALNATLDTAASIKVSPIDDGARYWSRDGGGVHPKLRPVADTLAQMLRDIKGLNKDTPGYFQKVKDLVQEVANTKTGTADLFSGLLPAEIKGLEKLASGLPSQALCQKLKDDATSTIRRKELLVHTALTDFAAELDQLLASGELILNTNKPQLIDDWTQRAVSHIQPLFTGASQDIAKVGLAVERARAIVLDANDELDAVFARARGRLEQFRAGYDESKPWSPERRRAFRAGAHAAIAGAIGDVEAAIDEAAQRLSVELGDVGQQIAGHVAKALRAVSAKESVLLGVAVKFEGIAEKFLESVDAQLLDANNGAQGALSKLLATINTHPALLKPENEQLRLDLVAAVNGVTTALAMAHDTAKQAGATLDAQIDAAVADFAAALDQLSSGLKNLGANVESAADAVLDYADALVQAGAEDIKAALQALKAAVTTLFEDLATEVDDKLVAFGTATDAVALPLLSGLDGELVRLHRATAQIPAQISAVADDINKVLDEVQQKLSPSGLLEVAVRPIIHQALTSLLAPLPDKLDAAQDLALARRKLQELAADVAERLRNYAEPLYEGVTSLTEACAAIAEGVGQAEAYLNNIIDDSFDYLATKASEAYSQLDAVLTAATEAAELIKALDDFDQSIRQLHNNVSRSLETANAYGDRVFDAISDIGHGGISAAPSKLLKLYSAVTGAPELAALKADIDRIRSSFDELGDIIEVTKTNAMFNRLGDELKALGLSIPFDRIGDRLLPADLSKLDIGSVFRNFGGAKLDRLFKGYKIPDGVRDAVKITHDFDKKQARAWVQIDIAAPFPGRRSLFSLGVFKADFVDMRLTGRVRLEASSDQEKVAVTGFGHIATTLDAVVGGQSMVKFERFGLEFTKEKGLDVQFDPKNAKLNPQFKWIQDFLSGLFPELRGGLEWIKENGIPVGVQHDFVLPNLSLTFGTSGISNISLENHFRLVAFPDFVIANRFNLSTIDRPFIFSIFIIGGTGYLQIEAEYKPVRNELAVLVEAGAGGSAQLAFAFGPFIGQIFITISGVLSYRKVLGKPGGGLSISMVLVITGQVDVCGLVTVGITLMLRMSYRDNGQVDADGTLTVTIRISRFFKLRARAQVNYKLRGGKSETTTSGDAGVETNAQGAKAIAAARRLEEALK